MSRAIVQAFFDKLGSEGDVDGWLDLLSDDISVYTPFSPKGDAIRFEGKEAVTRRFADARRRMPELHFLDNEILSTEDPERWICINHSRGKRGDGKPYQNVYCWILRIRDGKVAGWTEYFDPQEVLAVRG